MLHSALLIIPAPPNIAANYRLVIQEIPVLKKSNCSGIAFDNMLLLNAF